MRPIYTEKFILVLKQLVCIARLVLNLSGLIREPLLYKQITLNFMNNNIL